MDFSLSNLTSFWNKKKDSSVTKLITFYGLYKLGKYTYQLLKWVKTYFLRLTTDLKKRYGNGWVVITGATAGLGLAIARAMINNGMTRIVLMSRNLEKLTEVKSDLEKMKSQQTLEIEIVEYDFNRNYTENDVAELENKLSKYLPNISILFNNLETSHVGEFTKSDFSVIKRLINTNIYSTIFVTQTIIKSMIQKKERSLIVGIGSGSYIVAPRYMHLYAGTKAFMKPFFESLRDEYSEKIDFTYAHIGQMNINIDSKLIELPFATDSNLMANHLLTKIGRDNETYVNPLNAFFHSFLKNSSVMKRFMNSKVATKLESFVNNEKLALLN